MCADNNKGEPAVDEFSSPEEKILKQITSQKKDFISNLKNITTVDGVVRFLEKENINIDEIRAQKLMAALRYFDVDDDGQIKCNDSLENICGGVDNPFIRLFRNRSLV